MRFAAANQHPDQDTFAKSRRESFGTVSVCFPQLLLDKETGLLRQGTVRIEGTKVTASASKHRSLRYQRAAALAERLEIEIDGLPEPADHKGTAVAQKLSRETAMRKLLQEMLQTARERLEARRRSGLMRNGRHASGTGRRIRDKAARVARPIPRTGMRSRRRSG